MFIFYTALIIVLLITLLVFLAVLHYILPNFSAMVIGTIKLVVQSLKNFTYLLLSSNSSFLMSTYKSLPSFLSAVQSNSRAPS
ncbi:MAG: hypothetical protein MHMPM18_003450 [Marteilia pararefringens]